LSAAVLHTPLRIGGTTTVRNRLYRAPVLEGAGDGDDAAARYARHFVENAHHGVGLVIQGNSCLYEEGRTSPGMTLVNTRERMLRLEPMVTAVRREGAAIWIQVGHGGLFAMEAWHQPYASRRQSPLLAPSTPRWYLAPVFRRAPVHAMTTDEVHDMCTRYGEVASWAREAGYDGIQLASSNAKLLDQFLSPFYNRRTDEFGGSLDGRANLLRVIRERIAERAGADYTCTVKVPVGEKAPPFTPHTTWDEGLRLARMCQEFGYDSVTPVEVSVFPDTTLSRGGIPTSLWRNKGMVDRFRTAAPKRLERNVIAAGYVVGGVQAPFKPVWNRSRFEATKREVGIPVLAVGGIRTAAEVNEILESGAADLVGIGRPFYAEPDLAARILDRGDEGHDEHAPGLCRNSNLCVPAQMLGMKGVCYNPAVQKQKLELRRSARSGHEKH
jgi:2,4-dienoyl-CoA reductase-like NADH-dependent reductase (Old Yellow Enzyme family)